MHEGREEIGPAIEAVGRDVIAAALAVHRALGPGLLEQAYEACLTYELERLGRRVDRQVLLPVLYGDLRLEGGYRIDVLIDDEVVVEIKSVSDLAPVHEAQILTYLRLSGKTLGYLVNFNVPLLKQGLRRFVLAPTASRVPA